MDPNMKQCSSTLVRIDNETELQRQILLDLWLNGLVGHFIYWTSQVDVLLT